MLRLVLGVLTVSGIGETLSRYALRYPDFISDPVISVASCLRREDLPSSIIRVDRREHGGACRCSYTGRRVRTAMSLPTAMPCRTSDAEEVAGGAHETWIGAVHIADRG
jgi:hypothetical protein